MNEKDKKQYQVLVTGGGGFLGKSIVSFLLEKGFQVRVFARGAYPELKKLGVQVFQGDLRDISSLYPACKGCDSVFHVAAKVGVWGKYKDFYEINVEGTRNVISVCQQEGVKRLIFTSSPSVVFGSKDLEGVNESIPYPSQYLAHYPATKALAEREIVSVSRTLDTIVLRPHLIWGPGDPHLVKRLLERSHSLRRVGSGKNKTDTVYIDNAAAAHVLADQSLRANPSLSGQIYFISQGEPVLLWEMIDRMLEAGGESPVKGSISYNLAYILGASLEFLHKTFKIQTEPRMSRFVASELAKSHWFDIQAAKKDLGYDAKVTTEEGLRRLSLWLQRNKKISSMDSVNEVV